MKLRVPVGLLLSSLYLVGCATLNPVQTNTQNPSTTRQNLQLDAQLSEAEISDFLIQGLSFRHQGRFADRFKQAVKKLTKLRKKWYEFKRKAHFQRTPELLIEDVQLSETGESIKGSEASAALIPAYSDKRIELTLLGTFKERRNALKLEDFLFSYEPPLLQQTLVGEDPKSRVLLDDAIPLQVIQVEEDRIQVAIENQGLTDLYLKGLHKLSIEHGKYFTDTLIQIGDPEETDVSLQPRIDSAEVMRNDEGEPLHIRLTGANFMSQPKFSYTTIDGEFGFGFQTQVLESETEGTAWETIVHIPNPNSFDDISEHFIAYASPFGTAIYELSQEEQAQ